MTSARPAAQPRIIAIGDTIPEDIAYGWSGTPGDPLTRNDGVTNSDLITGVQSAVFEWIEAYYNRQRRHSTLRYMTPVEYEMKQVAA